jgi:hypothetical protein
VNGGGVRDSSGSEAEKMAMRADEHPEHLIDRALRGVLAPEEQVLLNRHVAGCSACALHVSLAKGFEPELAARPGDALLYPRPVEAALKRIRRASTP